jgi:hypothetical protein
METLPTDSPPPPPPPNTRRRGCLRGALITLCVVVTVPTILFRQRYCRTAVIRDLTVPQTQTVSIAFMPYHMNWSISGSVKGSGTVRILSGNGTEGATYFEPDSTGNWVMTNYVRPYFSLKVNGDFSTNGFGDYYATNTSLVFIPDGKATGKVRGTFFFNNFY